MSSAEHPPGPPPYTRDEARSRETYLALMWALSYPGRARALPTVTKADSFAAIADTLLDLETSYFTPDGSLAEYLARGGARALPPERAAYHFYPNVTEAELPYIERASAGTLEAPDTAATLIVGGSLDAGRAMTWTGPGINGKLDVGIGGLAEGLWALRARRVAYPLGWDVFFIDGQRVLGLPRSVRVE
jgi:alpha-D-ribose 1-methylphosphonate 5-triphosphate synthase subunit PhnH